MCRSFVGEWASGRKLPVAFAGRLALLRRPGWGRGSSLEMCVPGELFLYASLLAGAAIVVAANCFRFFSCHSCCPFFSLVC